MYLSHRFIGTFFSLRATTWHFLFTSGHYLALLAVKTSTVSFVLQSPLRLLQTPWPLQMWVSKFLSRSGASVREVLSSFRSSLIWCLP